MANTLPMTPTCALDESGAHVQLQRYRKAGERASHITRTPRRLTIEFDERVDGELVGNLVATERECCPFFQIEWKPRRRHLTFKVRDAEQEPALDAISWALDPSRRTGRERA